LISIDNRKNQESSCQTWPKNPSNPASLASAFVIENEPRHHASSEPERAIAGPEKTAKKKTKMQSESESFFGTSV